MENFLLFLYTWVSSFVSGLCLALMWKWFITPLGVPAITVIHAMGITLACAIIFAPKDPKKDPKKEITFGTVSYTIVFNIVALVFGYLIHLGM